MGLSGGPWSPRIDNCSATQPAGCCSRTAPPARLAPLHLALLLSTLSARSSCIKSASSSRSAMRRCIWCWERRCAGLSITALRPGRKRLRLWGSRHAPSTPCSSQHAPSSPCSPYHWPHFACICQPAAARPAPSGPLAVTGAVAWESESLCLVSRQPPPLLPFLAGARWICVAASAAARSVGQGVRQATPA